MAVNIHAEIDLLEENAKQTTLTPLKLGHLAFHVRDMKAITDFYIDVLGFRASDWRADVFAFLRCGPDHHTVNFFLIRNDTAKFHHVAFELKDWAEIQRASDFFGKNDETRVIWGPGPQESPHS